MGAIILSEQIRIPSWVNDHEAFRRWARSPEFPERGRFSYLAGDLWVDLSRESLMENQIKGAIAMCLCMDPRANRSFYLVAGMLLTNLDANLSTEPDGMYIANASLEAGLVRLTNGDDSPEVIGTPNMVLEIVSASSVEKDTVILPQLYWQAGIPEFWLVDSRADAPALEIHRRGRSKYTAVRPSADWVKSAVFGKSFRLVRRVMGHGVSEFTLETR